MLTRSLAVLVLLLASAARAASVADSGTTLNPDRWPTLELHESGESSFKSTNIVLTPGKPDNENIRRNLDVATQAGATLPLADPFSLSLAVGGDWSEVDSNVTGANGGSAAASSLLTYLVSGRWYFEPKDSPLRTEWVNPDRWTSLAATVSGSQTTNFSAGTVAGNTDVGSATSTRMLALDFRAPVARAWTLTGGAAFSRSDSSTGNSVPGTSSTTRTDTGSLSVGVRHYFVDHNMILDDGHRNPDMWTMVWLTATASKSLRDRQTLPSGLTRDQNARNYGLTAGVRVPVTDHASLSFSTRLNYGRSDGPAVGSATGYLTRTGSVNVDAGLRYFLF